MKSIAASIVTALSFALAQSAYSTFTLGTIDVDFNGSVLPSATASGAAVIGSPGDVWNVFNGTPTGAQALNLTTGAASSGVTLQVSGSQYITGTIGGANGPNTNLTQDFLAVGGAMQVRTGTITLAGLTSNQTYTFYLYNGSTMVSRITDYTVTAGTTVVASGAINNIGTLGTAVWTASNGVVPGNYLQLNATADSSGQLIIKFMNRAAAEGDFAGFQIRAIPEPSSYALLLSGVAILLIAFRARRRI